MCPFVMLLRVFRSLLGLLELLCGLIGWSWGLFGWSGGRWGHPAAHLGVQMVFFADFPSFLVPPGTHLEFVLLTLSCFWAIYPDAGVQSGVFSDF